MRFIRVHGRVVPIKDSASVRHSGIERAKNAAEGVATGSVAVGATYGLAKAGAKFSQASGRMEKLAGKNATNATKSAQKLQIAARNGQTGAKFLRRTESIANSTRRAESLMVKAGKVGLKGAMLKRGAFVVGGFGLGHAINKGIETVTGKEQGEKGVLASHAVGFSVSAVASSAIKSANKVNKLAYAQKVLSFARKLRG